jgi:hypothetical protein
MTIKGIGRLTERSLFGVVATVEQHATAHGVHLPKVLQRLRNGWPMQKAIEHGRVHRSDTKFSLERSDVSTAIRNGISTEVVRHRLLCDWPIVAAIMTPWPDQPRARR